jgi:hypothetical protein
LKGKKEKLSNEATFNTQSGDWKKYTVTLTATQNDDSASLVIVAKAKGKIALDMISLFPQKTFKNRSNGLRADLAQVDCRSADQSSCVFPAAAWYMVMDWAICINGRTRSVRLNSVLGKEIYGIITSRLDWVILNTSSFVKMQVPNPCPW